MRVTEKKIEQSQVYLTVEVEGQELDNSLDEAYKRLAPKTDVPGFRRGKAPRAVLERFLGSSLLEDALNEFLPHACLQVLRDENIQAIAEPLIEVTSTSPVVFKAIAPLAPSVKLSEYRTIKMKPEPVLVNDDDVDKVVEDLRHQQATWEAVDRPVKDRDLVAVDIVSDIEGKAFINRSGLEYIVSRGSRSPVPGFAEELIGLSIGEEKEFVLTLPQDFSNEEQAGKEVRFKVKVLSAKEEKLPELDADFIKSVTGDLDDLPSLRDRIRENMKYQLEEKARADFEDRIIEEVVKRSEVEFPPFLLENEIDYLVQGQLEEWRRYPGSVQESLKKIPPAKLRENFKPLATKRITRLLVIDELIRAENINVDEAEIDDEIDRMDESEDNKKTLKNTEENRDVVRRYLLRRKAMELLMEIAQDEEKKVEEDVRSE